MYHNRNHPVSPPPPTPRDSVVALSPSKGLPLTADVVPAKAGTLSRRSGAVSLSRRRPPAPPTVVPAQAGTSPSATRTSAHPTPRRRGGSRTARPAQSGNLPLRHQQPSPAPAHPHRRSRLRGNPGQGQRRGAVPLSTRPHPQERESNTHTKQPHKNKTAPDIPAKNRNPGAAPTPRATSNPQPTPTPTRCVIPAFAGIRRERPVDSMHPPPQNE